MENATAKQKKNTLALQIFIALLGAIIVGLLMQKIPDVPNNYVKPFGTIFLNLVKFMVCPLVLFSIMAGVVSMRDMKRLGVIGGTTLVYYFCTTAVAVIIGLLVSSLFKGFFPVLSTVNLSFTPPQAPSAIETIVNMFPSNFIVPISSANMIQVIVMAILISFAIILIGEKAETAIDTINQWNIIFMKCMEIILKLSPIGVFCLLMPVIASNGALVIGSLAKVILAAYICYILHAAIVYSFTVSTLGGINPVRFFREMAPAITFAFSSASSVGTIPLNMECTKRLGFSEEVSSFVLPLGATINMDGTAIYQGVCSVFIAACYGIDLTMSQMISIVLTATLASVGTAGVSGAGVVMLAMVLSSVGLPVDGIALVVGVDRIFDMGRTTLNITGDASCTVIVSNLLKKREMKKAAKTQV
ncbi:MAG: dicarboxylate/amino acid:cation symporter [Treponema sp.]|nr:dicarboxylate/amino acid:cation symporter [Treponema sp.]